MQLLPTHGIEEVGMPYANALLTRGVGPSNPGCTNGKRRVCHWQPFATIAIGLSSDTHSKVCVLSLLPRPNHFCVTFASNQY